MRNKNNTWKIIFLLCSFFLFIAGSGKSEILEQSFSKNIILLRESSYHIEEKVSHTIFKVQIPKTGQYYLSAKTLVCENQLGLFTNYKIMVNGKLTTGALYPQKGGWENILATQPMGKIITLSLKKGENIITFIGKLPLVPNIEYIQLSLNFQDISIFNKKYENTLKTNSSIRTSPAENFPIGPQHPNYKYFWQKNFTYNSSLITTYYFQAGDTIHIETHRNMNWGYTYTPYILSVFNIDNPAEASWVCISDDATESANIHAIIPYSGFYYLRARSRYPGEKGEFVMSVNKTDHYKFLPLSYEGTFPVSLNAGVEYGTYVRKLTPNQKTKIIVEGENRILAYNDGSKYFILNDNFTKDTILYIKQTFPFPVTGIYINASYAPNQGVCDIYTGCQTPNISPQSSSDILVLSDRSSDYNCYAWAGGIVTNIWDGNLYAGFTNPYHVPGSKLNTLKNFFSNNPVKRYEGAESYEFMEKNMDDSRAVIDIWGHYDTIPEHASIRNGADNNEHGFAWESKYGLGDRIFHPRMFPAHNYGNIIGHFKHSSHLRSTNRGISMEESLAEGLSVIEQVELTKREQDLLNIAKQNLAPITQKKFEKLYNHWKTDWTVDSLLNKENKIYTTKTYNELLSFCKTKGKSIWPMIFEKYSNDGIQVSPLLEAMTYTNYPQNHAILDSIKNYNIKNQYNDSGKYVIRTPYSIGMKYIQSLISDNFTPSFFHDLKSKKIVSGISYSNSDKWTIKNNTANSLLSIDICPEPNSFVIIDIYDLNGNKIATIYNGRTTNSQVNQQEWNYGNIQPGIYLVRYIVNNRINIKKIIIK